MPVKEQRRIPADRLREAIVTVRLRHAERRALNEAAREDGITASEWIRRAILVYLA